MGQKEACILHYFFFFSFQSPEKGKKKLKLPFLANRKDKCIGSKLKIIDLPYAILDNLS